MKITVTFDSLEEMDKFCNGIAIAPGVLKEVAENPVQEKTETSAVQQATAPAMAAAATQQSPAPVMTAPTQVQAPVGQVPVQPSTPVPTLNTYGTPRFDYDKNPVPINTTPIIPGGPVPAAGVAQNPMPPVQGPVPTTAVTQQYSFDQLAVATANLASTGKDVFPILGKFNAKSLMDVPQERYGEYAAALREAGAVI